MNLPAEVIFDMLDRLRAEVIETVETPPEASQNAFGFGKVTGGLFVLKELRARVDAFIEEADRKFRSGENEEE